MNYSSPANNNTKDHVVAELPKPSKHESESEVLLEKGVRVTGGGFVPKKRISDKSILHELMNYLLTSHHICRKYLQKIQ